ncbi:MAG: hypothetical protein ACJ73S_21215 [Mycobacteriales bacterium]
MRRGTGADTANRVLFVLLGLLAVGGGGWCLWLSGSRSGYADQPVLGTRLEHWVGRHGTPFWWAVGGAGLLVTLLALVWLLAQGRTGRVGVVPVSWDPEAGATTVAGSAVAQAVTGDAGGVTDVVRARVTVRTDADVDGGHRLVMVLTVGDRADFRTVCREVERTVLPRARLALAREALPATVQLTATEVKPRRVV